MGDRVSFVRQDLRPASVRDLDPETLSPRAKALLFLPDLVTDFVEAAFHEPVAVTCLSQVTNTCVDDPSLETMSTDPVVDRASLIYGADTNRSFIHAVVRLAESRVPEGLITDLVEKKTGLGRLLDAYQVEHNREMLWYGVERRAESRLDLREVLEGNAFVARCYRLVTAGKPCATIEERFSLNLFGCK